MLHDIKINEFIPECIGAKENHFSTHCVIIIFLHFYCYSFCGEFPNDPQTLCLRRKLSIAKVLMIAVSMEWLIWVFNRLSSWQRRPGRSANDVRTFISVTNVCFVFINTLGMEIAWLRWSFAAAEQLRHFGIIKASLQGFQSVTSLSFQKMLFEKQRFIAEHI